MAIETATGFLKGTQTAAQFGILNNILKEYYLPGVRDLFNNKTPLLRYIRKSMEYMQGQYAVIPLNTGRNEGHGHVGEGGDLPDPGVQSYKRATYDLRYMYGRIKFSGPSQDATSSKAGSYLEVMNSEVTGLARDMTRDLNRIAFGDGTGRLARVSATVTASTSVPLDRPGGFANLGPGTKFMRQGMRVMFVRNTGLGSVIAVRTLSSVNYETNVVTVDSAVTLAADDYLVRCSSPTTTALNSSSWFLEPNGLAGIISDQNPFDSATPHFNYIGQIDRTTTPLWQSTVIDHNGTPTEFYVDVLNQLQDVMDISGDGVIQLYMTTHGIRRAHLNLMLANKTFPNIMELDGGYKTLEHNGIPLVPDRDCTNGRIYGLDFRVLHMFLGEDFNFIDQDGSVLARMQNQDAYQCTLKRYHQFGTDAANRLGVVLDIKDE